MSEQLQGWGLGQEQSGHRTGSDMQAALQLGATEHGFLAECCSTPPFCLKGSLVVGTGCSMGEEVLNSVPVHTRESFAVTLQEVSGSLKVVDSFIGKGSGFFPKGAPRSHGGICLPVLLNSEPTCFQMFLLSLSSPLGLLSLLYPFPPLPHPTYPLPPSPFPLASLPLSL